MDCRLRGAVSTAVTTVEMFSDVTICINHECRVVQVMHRWWLYADGSSVLSLHRVDDPLSGESMIEDDPGARRMLETRTRAMWQLGGD